MLIGISGKIGHGKDTAAFMLQEIFHQKGIDLVKRQFAGKLKEFVASLIGCSLEQLEDQDFKRSVLAPQWTKTLTDTVGYEYGAPIKGPIEKPMTVRDLLISIGHGLRVSTHDALWVNGLFADYTLTAAGGYPEYGINQDGGTVAIGYNTIMKYPDWIIPDMRYPNEANRIKEHGGFNIRIQRDSIPSLDHPSETLLDAYNFDLLIVNNSSLDDLRSSLENAVNTLLK